MAPNHGLVHPKQYDIEESNVELIGSDIDKQVRYHSAVEEPAWNNGKIGAEPGLFVWRIEAFEVKVWPKEQVGRFYNGDSYIILYSYKVGDKNAGTEKLCHDIFFWLGSETTQDEAGTAAYKTVELDSFLQGAATQHRETEANPSAEFVALFPRITILRGGVRTGFRHVDVDGEKEEVPPTLLRVVQLKGPAGRASTLVQEVHPTWESLDDGDVFILDSPPKIWVWQGRGCSPMEKAKAAQVVHDMKLAKHAEVEVLAQSEPRSGRVVSLLGGSVTERTFSCPRPVTSPGAAAEPREGVPRLLRLSDASGSLSFHVVKEGKGISRADLDGADVFLLDTGRAIWVWVGGGASKGEKAAWLQFVNFYVRQLGVPGAARLPTAKTVEGNEPAAFVAAMAA